MPRSFYINFCLSFFVFVLLIRNFFYFNHSCNICEYKKWFKSKKKMLFRKLGQHFRYKFTLNNLKNTKACTFPQYSTDRYETKSSALEQRLDQVSGFIICTNKLIVFLPIRS